MIMKILKPRKGQEPLFYLYGALNRAIKFHSANTNDPHGISNAVICALTEVRDALRYALDK